MRSACKHACVPLELRRDAQRLSSIARVDAQQLRDILKTCGRLNTYLADGLEPEEAKHTDALVSMRRVRLYVGLRVAPSRPREKLPKRKSVVRCHGLNILALGGALPRVQQACGFAEEPEKTEK